jgi:hypothetical protein
MRAKIVNLVGRKRSRHSLFLSGQQLFEALPPFGIEAKNWLCST